MEQAPVEENARPIPPQDSSNYRLSDHGDDHAPQGLEPHPSEESARPTSPGDNSEERTPNDADIVAQQPLEPVSPEHNAWLSAAHVARLIEKLRPLQQGPKREAGCHKLNLAISATGFTLFRHYLAAFRPAVKKQMEQEDEVECLAIWKSLSKYEQKMWRGGTVPLKRALSRDDIQVLNHFKQTSRTGWVPNAGAGESVPFATDARWSRQSSVDKNCGRVVRR